MYGASNLRWGDMMRRSARRDGNHAEIVATLRAAGCGVCDLAAVGAGVPDLLVCGPTWPHGTMLLEVKDSSKPPSARKLTPAQVIFHASWSGAIYVVTSPDQALAAVLGVRL